MDGTWDSHRLGATKAGVKCVLNSGYLSKSKTRHITQDYAQCDGWKLLPFGFGASIMETIKATYGVLNVSIRILPERP